MVHKLQCNTILYYGFFVVVKQNWIAHGYLIVKPWIYEVVCIVICETHQYCNSRFLGYKGLLNRVQSNLNITVNLMDFKIAIVNYEEFIPKKKKHKICSQFFLRHQEPNLSMAGKLCIYIYTHIQQQNLQSSLNLAITLSSSNVSTLF